MARFDPLPEYNYTIPKVSLGTFTDLHASENHLWLVGTDENAQGVLLRFNVHTEQIDKFFAVDDPKRITGDDEYIYVASGGDATVRRFDVTMTRPIVKRYTHDGEVGGADTTLNWVSRDGRSFPIPEGWGGGQRWPTSYGFITKPIKQISVFGNYFLSAYLRNWSPNNGAVGQGNTQSAYNLIGVINNKETGAISYRNPNMFILEDRELLGGSAVDNNELWMGLNQFSETHEFLGRALIRFSISESGTVEYIPSTVDPDSADNNIRRIVNLPSVGFAARNCVGWMGDIQDNGNVVLKAYQLCGGDEKPAFPFATPPVPPPDTTVPGRVRWSTGAVSSKWT